MAEAIAHHDVHRDDEGSKLGIWLFIFTELLFFGGLFITYAAHIAAMAPGTNIGSASPVQMGGAGMDSTMAHKVTNDAAAYIASIAAGIEEGRIAYGNIRKVIFLLISTGAAASPSGCHSTR